MEERMRVGAAAIAEGSLRVGVDGLVAAAAGPLAGQRPDLAVLYVTGPWAEEAEAAAARVQDATGARVLIGCTAEGVIGPHHEYERQPAASLMLAALPGARVEPFHVSPETLERLAEATEDDGEEAAGAWRAACGLPDDGPSTLMLLADPYSFDADAFLGGLETSLPQVQVIGGLASGGRGPETSLLLRGGFALRGAGAIGVSLSGDLQLETVVSQGCRPIGRPFVVTAADGNVVRSLAGKPPLLRLQQVAEGASERDRRLLRRGLFLGRAIDEQKHAHDRGDFLIRNVMGIDPDSGAIAVTDAMRAGITVQFHVRDAESADEDLRQLLARHAGGATAGAMVFSCNGRGTRMYRDQDHDLGVLRELLGEPAVGGFFCAGEIGPVGGRNFMHGYTASIALLREPAVGDGDGAATP
jgi:small ligand-binding sensory domain FIST